MFRVGTELERALNELASRQTGSVELVGRVAAITGFAVSIIDGMGREVVRSGPSDPSADGAKGQSPFLTRELSFGNELVLGPLTGGDHALARFIADRVVMSANLALRYDDELRPRGAGRTAAIRGLLERVERNPSGRRSAAIALGFDPDGVYIVAVTPERHEPAMSHVAAIVGSVHPAGVADGDQLWMIDVTSGARTEHVAAWAQKLKRAWVRERPDSTLTMALSAPTIGVEGLPAAADEAKFIAALQRSGELPRRAASFDSLEDLGAVRVLYQLRQSPELRHFVEQVLLPLAGRETLRATLKVFLESGGSQVEAAKRLGIHRNTLAYRLRRVGSLVGVDVTDPAAWLTFHLAISAADLFRMTTTEG
jgi:sugar diacid utilization regulator